jgi:murein DD-endopeptidase MepM/ murein hydrolase activator NlpD
VRYQLLTAFAAVLLASCSHSRVNLYESSSRDEQTQFKTVAVPFPKGTSFTISQGAFGKYTHSDKGREYSWDFDVPFGTPVIAIEGGTVIQVWQLGTEGGCDPKYSESAHNIKVRHADGTVAQYVHIKSDLTVGTSVKSGETIAVTAKNGYICTPQLDFWIYLDQYHLPGSAQMRSIPLLFEGLPDGGMAREGYSGVVP